MSRSVKRIEKGLNGIGTLCIMASVALIALFAIIVIWPDFEAEVAGRMMPDLDTIETLRCPLLVTEKNGGIISASFTNPSDQTLRLRLDSEITEGSLAMMRADGLEIFIPANETEVVEWVVSADDAALDRIIVARFHALRNSQMAARASNCGILVLNISLLSGRQIIISLVVGIVLLLGSGLRLILAERPFTRRGKRLLLQLSLLVVSIAIPLLAGLVGLGLVALPLAVIPALVLISLMEFALQ